MKSVAIIGAGHNALVCAAYLARAGFAVEVFERRPIVGGLCVSEELMPGYTVSSLAGWSGMLRQHIVADLELASHGLKINPVTEDISLFSTGEYVFESNGQPLRHNLDASAADLEAWRAFGGELSKAAELIKPLLLQPGTTQKQVEQTLSAHGLDRLAKALFAGNILDYVRTNIGHDALGLVAATSTLNTLPHQPGSLFQAVYLATGQGWGIPKGGLGAVTEALAAAAQSYGVSISCDTPVKGVRLVGRGASLEFADGSIKQFDVVISGADPLTSLKLLGQDQQWNSTIQDKLPLYTSAKIHLALSAQPRLRVVPDAVEFSSINLVPTATELRDLTADVENQRIAQHNTVTIAIPSVRDASAAPDGRAVLSASLYAVPVMPYGREWDDNARQEQIQNVIAQLSQHFVGLESLVEDCRLITPSDLAQTYGVATKHCYHLPSYPELLFENRAITGQSPYTTPHANYFICGSGMYPGGTVSGIPGYNCAQQIIQTFAAKEANHAR